MLFFGLNLSGQSSWIDSLYSNPFFPTIEDTVRVIGEIRTSSAGCELSSSEILINELDKEIEIFGCYAIGPLDTICPSIDTFLIGQLQEGEYNVTLTSKVFETITNPNGDCTNSISETVKEIEIKVSGTNSIERIKKELINFELINNPVSDYAKFKIDSSEEDLRLIIVDNFGKVVIWNQIERNYNKNRIIRIDVIKFPQGIYFCYLENKNGKSKPIKMIKN